MVRTAVVRGPQAMLSRRRSIFVSLVLWNCFLVQLQKRHRHRIDKQRRGTELHYCSMSRAAQAARQPDNPTLPSPWVELCLALSLSSAPHVSDPPCLNLPHAHWLDENLSYAMLKSSVEPLICMGQTASVGPWNSVLSSHEKAKVVILSAKFA